MKVPETIREKHRFFHLHGIYKSYIDAGRVRAHLIYVEHYYVRVKDLSPKGHTMSRTSGYAIYKTKVGPRG